MKYNKKGIIGIALAAMMIASIFAVFTLPVLSNPDKCEDQPGALTVDIVIPEMNDTFTECTHFYVDAVIANSLGIKLEDVNATITIKGNATLVTGENPTKPLIDIVPNGVVDVWWELHCNGSGDVKITVNATALKPGTGYSNESFVIVKQVKPLSTPVLDVEIFQYPLVMIEECDVFGVKANITHIGGDTAYNLKATIDWDPFVLADLVDMPNNWSLPDMNLGDMHEVGWTMHCNGSGDVNITVDVTGDIGVCPPEPVPVKTDTVTVHQKMPANLTLVIIDPENNTKICTECDDTFVVTAEITNTGDAKAYGITAAIIATAGAGSVVITPPLTKPVLDLPGGSSDTVSWDVTCSAIGASTFNVTAIGYCDWTGATLTPSDEVTIHQKDFKVEITSPAEGSTFSSCQNFEVIANITNCLDIEIAGFNVTFDFSDLGADFIGTPRVDITHKPKAGWPDSLPMNKLAPGIYNVTFTESFCECCYAELRWDLECLNNTDGNITVNATKIDGTILPDEDSVFIEQEWKADLAAGIETFVGTLNIADPYDDTFITDPAGSFAVCQNFTVVVPVTNWGEADATNVSIAINVAGKAVPNGTLPSYLIGTIPGGESRKAFWELHCTGKGDVTIGILDGDLTGKDANTGVSVLAANIHLPCDKIVTQTPFTVEIIEPVTCTDILLDQQFTVKTNITNGGDETLKDINATIHIKGDARRVIGQPVTISIGDLKPGNWVHAPTWQLECYAAPDEVYITVSVTAKTEAGDMYEIWSNEVNVHQKKPADVTVVLLSPLEPDDGYTYIPTGMDFMVTAAIYNDEGCIDANITDADVNIDCDDCGTTWGLPDDCTAHVVSGPDPALPIVLAGGEYQIVSWVLHADFATDPWDAADEDTDIWVTAKGKDAFGNDIDEDSALDDDNIFVYPAARLEVEITEPDDGERKAFGSDFTVSATITNTGQSDVWEGRATLSVVPENSLLLAEGGYTQDIGTLVGHGANGSKTFNWTVQCEELGKSTITVTASGKDEFGYEPWCDDCCCDDIEALPGRDIPEQHIEPASITVKQVTEEELVEPFDDNITLQAGWNFISVPKKLVLAQSTVGGFILGTNVTTAFAYDPATGWIPLVGPEPINVLGGYWMYDLTEDTITLSYLTGGQMVPPSKDLTGKAWNAIGFSSTAAKSASTTLKSVEGSWSTVIGWDETGQQYESAIIYEVNDEELMYPGKGYWDWMTADDTLSAISV